MQDRKEGNRQDMNRRDFIKRISACLAILPLSKFVSIPSADENEIQPEINDGFNSRMGDLDYIVRHVRDDARKEKIERRWMDLHAQYRGKRRRGGVK